MNISVTQNVQKFLDCINKSGPLVGFDLGTKTIGVAISDESRTIASPVLVIKRKKFSEDLEKIKDLEKKYQFTGIILGLPINMNGTEGPRCQSTRSFASKISLSTKNCICLWDERLSTVGAFKLTSQLNVNVSKREKKIDENAATFILQGAIDFLNN